MYRTIRIFVVAIFLACPVFAQPKGQPKFEASIRRGFIFEAVQIPADSGAECYVTYRVEYNKLVFLKEESKFVSRFSVSVEAVDSASGKIFRDSQKKEFSVDNYELTDAPYKYVQGLIKFKLNPGKYKIFSTVYDENSGSESRFPPSNVVITAKGEKNIFLNPLVVQKETDKNNQSYYLANYEGNIPFLKDPLDLIIPVKDTSLTSLNVEIWNEDTLLIKDVLHESFVSSLDLLQDGNDIKVSTTSSNLLTRNFVIRGFNKQLQEGGVRIKLSYGNETRTIVKNVVWYNRPFVMFNTEYAIKMLKYIASESEIEKITQYSGIKLYWALLSYWKKYDPTPETAFNEIMEEYYQRVDYAINNFSLVSTKNGAETDRGKIFIKFGQPQNIERTYSSSKDVKEIWHYNAPQKEFVFIDKTGMGNFVLNQSL
ncbi:MAG: GWxTD domain-containing protein [Bacteroidota bacterium]|nr:GWxTD domain-containing protein [Bacteroidota bacterium]MDP4195936.1 GWxTD domain-containing protein [Bacteroidota bacterium]